MSKYRKPHPKVVEVEKEKVVPHTVVKKVEGWAYSLKEGGQRYSVALPTTESQIEKVKVQLQNKANWKFYIVSPYGGDRAYTQITCFPPFDLLPVAEVFLPDGTVWKSNKRKFVKA